MFDNLLQQAGGLAGNLGGIGETINSIQQQLPSSDLAEDAKGKISQSLQGIQQSLSKMPPDFTAIQQHVQTLQAVAQSYGDNPLVKQIQEKILPLAQEFLAKK